MAETKKMNANLRTILERVAKDPVVFVYAPHGKGVKLESSSVSPSLKKHIEALTLTGHVSRKDSGEPTGCPPTMSTTFTVTALGREELDMHKAVKPDERVTRPLTESELLAQAQG
jgi:hypothetical protein